MSVRTGIVRYRGALITKVLPGRSAGGPKGKGWIVHYFGGSGGQEWVGTLTIARRAVDRDLKHKNPSPSSLLPLSWKKAQVRRLPDGRVQVKIPRPKVKMKTYYSKTLGRRVTIPEGR